MESCVADVLIEAMKKRGFVRRDFDRMHNKQSLETETFNSARFATSVAQPTQQ